MVCYSLTYLLLLFVISSPSVSVSPPEPELGSKATLLCEVKGQNQGSTVQWKGPDNTLNGNNVDLNPVASKDKGTWTCVITQDGETHIEKITLNIRGIVGH